MIKILFILAALVLGGTLATDTAVVRSVLDRNGYTTVPVSAVTDSTLIRAFNRVTFLKFSSAVCPTVFLSFLAESLSAIQEVHWDNCNLTQIPDAAYHFFKANPPRYTLRRLSFNNNLLDSIPVRLFATYNRALHSSTDIGIGRIDFNHNRVKRLLSGGICCSSLAVLDVSYNQIDSLDIWPVPYYGGLIGRFRMQNDNLYIDHNKLCNLSALNLQYLGYCAAPLWKTTQTCSSEIESNLSNNGIASMFPNPCNNFIRVSDKIKIYSVNGAFLFSGIGMCDMTKFSSGAYLYKIESRGIVKGILIKN